MKRKRPSRHQTASDGEVNLVLPALVVVASLAAYLQTCWFEFVNWDNDVHLYENPYLNPVSWSHLGHLWTNTYDAVYIPLTYTVYSLVGWLSMEPGGFHLVNVLLHTVNALLVWAIARQLVPSPHDLAAGVAALLFCLHPVQVEAVAWASGTKDLLYGFFALWCVWFALCQPTSWKSSLGATACYCLALLSKPTAVMVPLLVLALVYLLRRQELKVAALRAACWLVLALPMVVVTRQAQPETSLRQIAPLWARPLVMGDGLTFYLAKLLVPFNLGPDYGRSPEMVMESAWFYLAWLAPVALVVVAWKQRWHWMVAALVVLFVGTLPNSGLMPYGFQFYSTVSDRYLYVPILGAALCLGYVAAHWRPARWAALAFVVACGLLTARQATHWQDSTALWHRALQVNPRSFVAHNNLGLELADQGRNEEAIEHYSHALKIRPDYAEAHNNIGVEWGKQRQRAKAFHHFSEAVRLEPNMAEAHNNLGIAYARQRRMGLAIKHFSRAVRLEPTLESAQRNLRRAQGKAAP
jgi:hypothetical protein